MALRTLPLTRCQETSSSPFQSYSRTYSSLMTPASRTKRTCLARPLSSGATTSAVLMNPAQSGYDGKSAITFMIVVWSDAIVMLDCAWSTMARTYNSARASPLEDVGRARAAEVPDVDALRATDPHPSRQRVMVLPEQHELRLRVPD